MQLSIDNRYTNSSIPYHTIVYLYNILFPVWNWMDMELLRRSMAESVLVLPLGGKKRREGRPYLVTMVHVIRKWCHGAIPVREEKFIIIFFPFPSISLAFRRRRNSPCRLGRRVLRATDTQTREEKASGKRGTPWWYSWWIVGVGLDLGVVCGCGWRRKKRKKRGSEKKSARKKKCGCYKCHSDYLSMMTRRFSKRSRSIRYGVATVFFPLCFA